MLLLIVILSALLAFLSARLFSRKVSPVYAILAAAGGLRLAQGEPVLALWGYPFSWFVAPILAAGLAALLTFLTELILRKSGAHLFHRMRVMGNLIKYSKYLLIACAALNFRPLLIRGTGFVFEWLIPVAVYLAALAVVCVLFKSEYKAVMSSDYDLSLPEKFASLLAVSAVLLLFSIGPAAGLVRLPAGIGTETMLRLPAGPHSALLLLMAAVVLVYVAKQDLFVNAVPSILGAAALFDRLSPFSSGLFDLTAVVFYVTCAVLFVWLTVQSMEKKRWM